MPIKDWNQSKTVILNAVSAVLSLIIMLATLFAGPEVAALGVPPEVARWAAIVLLVANVLNLWLRSLTTSALRLPGEDMQAAERRIDRSSG